MPPSYSAVFASFAAFGVRNEVDDIDNVRFVKLTKDCNLLDDKVSVPLEQQDAVLPQSEPDNSKNVVGHYGSMCSSYGKCISHEDDVSMVRQHTPSS